MYGTCIIGRADAQHIWDSLIYFTGPRSQHYMYMYIIHLVDYICTVVSLHTNNVICPPTTQALTVTDHMSTACARMNLMDDLILLIKAVCLQIGGFVPTLVSMCLP